MTDLVKRLRKFSGIRAFRQGELFSEAADRIKELEVENDALRRFKPKALKWKRKYEALVAWMMKHKRLIHYVGDNHELPDELRVLLEGDRED